MLLYNITFGVDPDSKEGFIEWLNSQFIPVSVADHEYFSSPELMKVLTADTSVDSYALHMRAENLNDISLWYEDHGSRLFDYIQKHWNGKVVFFATTLQILK